MIKQINRFKIDKGDYLPCGNWFVVLNYYLNVECTLFLQKSSRHVHRGNTTCFVKHWNVRMLYETGYFHLFVDQIPPNQAHRWEERNVCQESEWSCICVLEVSILPLSIILECSMIFIVFHLLKSIDLWSYVFPNSFQNQTKYDTFIQSEK
jgi:hypothetical protein